MCKAPKGFTLFELLVVLLLMGLALGLIVPKLRLWRPSATSLAEEVKGLLESARLQAINRGEDLLVLIDPEERLIFSGLLRQDEEGRWQVEKIFKEVSLPEELEVKQRGLFRIGRWYGLYFSGQGISSGGEIELVLERKRYLIRISAEQFLVTLEEES